MKNLLTLLVVTFTFTLKAQDPMIEWQKTIGGSNQDVLTAFEKTVDGGYILGGQSYSDASGEKSENSNGAYDYWIVKIDATGNIQWQNTIGGDRTDNLVDIKQTFDGGYICGGYSMSNVSGDKTEAPRDTIGGTIHPFDYWVIKIDSLGNIEWQKTLGGYGNEQLYSTQQTADGGYIVSGHSNSDASADKSDDRKGLYDCWILKLSAAGNIQWQKTIGGSDNEGACKCIPVNNGYILTADSKSDISGDKTENNKGRADYWIVRLDTVGNILWQKTIGGSADDFPTSVDTAPDGGFVISGSSYSNQSGDKLEDGFGVLDITGLGVENADIWVIKLDSLGNIQWENTIGGNIIDNANTVKLTLDQGYIVGGFSSSNISGDKTENSLGSFDYWLIKLDAAGNILWQNTIGGSARESLNEIHQTSDSSFILAGSSVSGISGDKNENNRGSLEDFWIIKLIPCGLLVNTIDTTICMGDSVFTAGSWQKESGIFYDTIFPIHGCVTAVTITRLTVDSCKIWLWGTTSPFQLVSTIFKVSTSGAGFTLVDSFFQNPGTYGWLTDALHQGNDCKLYGTTQKGGNFNSGVLFEYDLIAQSRSKLFDFDTLSGIRTGTNVIQASNGKVYGLTAEGGANGHGVLYEYDPFTGNYTVKINFDGSGSGSYPTGSLMETSDGRFFGMTAYGGVYGWGTLFEFFPDSNRLVKKIDFGNGNSGKEPFESLMEAADGMLYGYTYGGGIYNIGTIFRYDPQNDTLFTLYNVTGGANGSELLGTPVQAGNGKLYGIMDEGDAVNVGYLFEYDIINNSYAIKLNFDGVYTGYPLGNLILASNGKLYGTALVLYDNVVGIIYEYDVLTSTYRVVYEATDPAISPRGTLVEVFAPTTSHLSFNICPGDSILAGGNYQYNAGIYYDTLVRASGCDSIVIIQLAVDSCSTTNVWPGDANSDGIANNQDVLAIGIGYGFTGPIRPNASTTWIGQPCPDWIGTFSNGVNFKHADCNGEGIVDSNDVSVISLNYGLTHQKQSAPQRSINSDLFLVFPQDSFQTGDTVKGEIHLGTQATPVNDVYGIAFSLTYDQNIIDSNGISIDFVNSWFTPQTNRIGLAKNLYAAAKTDVGLSRTSHSNASGSGAIANVSFVIQDNIDGKDYFVLPLEIQFEEVIAIDKDEASVNITANGDTLYIEGETVGINPIHQQFNVRIFPNPATDEINLMADVSIIEYSIMDITGRQVLGEIPSLEEMESLLTIDVSALETGSYFLQLKTADHYSICKKIVICK